MADPYEVLELQPGASEEEIRHRYLDLVRRHPPDRDPKRFASIREAYDELRDPVTRLSAQLFGLGDSDSLDTVFADVQKRVRSARIPVKALLSLAEK